MTSALIQRFIFAVIINPALWLLIGLRVRNRHGLPLRGPAIIVANHNSHLDTIVLMSLVPGHALKRYRPAAAADHFMKPGFVGFMARNILRILAIDRSGTGAQTALEPVTQAITDGEIVILFPEGTRGEPEHRARFRRGIAMLVEAHPDVPVIPVFIYGLGRALPKGSSLLVPFFCDVVVGEPMDLRDHRPRDMPNAIGQAVDALGAGLHVDWQQGSSTDAENIDGAE